MRADKRQQDDPPQSPSEASAPSAGAPNDIAALRADCLSQLNAIAARVRQLSAQSSADWTRSMREAQMHVQMRQQAMMSDYLSKAQQASTRAGAGRELNDLSKRCNEEFENAQREAAKSVDESREKLRATVESGIEEANRDWDAACQRFVEALRERLSRSTSAAPAELAGIGQSLLWIASLMRAPKAG